jgi:hypothetical protein
MLNEGKSPPGHFQGTVTDGLLKRTVRYKRIDQGAIEGLRRLLQGPNIDSAGRLRLLNGEDSLW